MRITHDMILQNALRGIGKNLETLHRANEEVVTGRRIRRPSDQPLDAAVLMRLDSRLRAVEGYRRAGVDAGTRLSTEEAVLTSVGDMVQRIKDLVADVASASDDLPREAAIREVRALRGQIISLGNTKVGGQYIFGGGRTDAPPFRDDGTYAGDANVHRVDLGDGLRADTNHTGDEILSGVIESLDLVVSTLESGDPDSIQASLQDVDSARESITRGLGEIGSRMRLVRTMEEQLVQQASTLLDRRSEIQDADTAESVVKLSEAQASLERAYASVARILSTNILQFLR